MAKTTLLIVEDDTLLLSSMQEILELREYDVLTAENGRQALDVMDHEDTPTPDLIVSDIMMPYIDGHEFLKKVRAREEWLTIPFIFLTAKGEKEDIREGKQMGVDDYLVKPFDPPDLLVAIDNKLENLRRYQRAKHNEMNAVIDDVKEQIVTLLNHEMRTPLSLIVGYSDMLNSFSLEEMSVEEIRIFLQGVYSGAERLRRLIENFIFLVELNSGDCAKTYEWRSYKLDSLDGIINTAYTQIMSDETINLDCTIDIAPNLPQVHGDKEYLTVIIRELLSNACKFSGKSSTKPIELKVARVDNEVCISVKDYGIGIASQYLDDIWKIFFQIERKQDEQQGAGSGLTLVKSFVDLHNGRVDVTSMPDEGSTFYVYLPVAD